jgi:hypothetical protein
LRWFRDVDQDAAEPAVVFVVETFQIDLVGVHVGADEIEHLRGGVAVGDVGAAQAAGAGLLEDFHGPFAGDERLVVAGGDDGSAVVDGQIDELFGGAKPRRGDGFGVAEHLAGDPVLAIAAVIIAAEHSEGEGVAAGQDVEEGLFLDGVAGESADVAVRDHERAAAIEADAADAVAAGLDETAMAAGETLDVAVVPALDQGLGGGDGVLVQHLLHGGEALFVLADFDGHGCPIIGYSPPAPVMN